MRKLFPIALMALAALTLWADGEEKKIAVFARNRTKEAALTEELPAIVDRMSVAFAEIENFQVVETTLAEEEFKKGGSAARLAQLCGADYVAEISVVGATKTPRNISGRLATVFTLKIAMKVSDAAGKSVDGFPTWSRQYPVMDAAGEVGTYYELLLDQWGEEVASKVAEKAAKWRKVDLSSSLATCHISTTIDSTISELEEKLNGVPGEQKIELRRVVGGATIAIDGAVIGSAPGDFQIAKGLHSIKIEREWMKPYEATVNISEGFTLEVALEFSEAGVAKWGTVEALRADLTKRYAEAAMTRGIKVNIDTKNVQKLGNDIILP